MTTSTRAQLALLLVVCMWSYGTIIGKQTLIDIPPMLLLLLRMSVAAAVFLPIFLRERPWRHPMFFRLLGISCFSAINVSVFLFGFQYTSASVSQLIYALMPILVMVYDQFVQKVRYPAYKSIGVLLGFSGIMFIVYLSIAEQGTTITGSLRGNIAILVATLSWTAYVLSSKALSRSFSSLAIGSTSVMVSLFVSIPLALAEYIFFRPSVTFSPWALFGAFYIGFFGTFLAYVFYQYGIRHSSVLTVSLTSYLQPITTTALATAILHERMTPGYLAGVSLVFSGIFLATTVQIFKKRKRKN